MDEYNPINQADYLRLQIAYIKAKHCNSDFDERHQYFHNKLNMEIAKFLLKPYWRQLEEEVRDHD